MQRPTVAGGRACVICWTEQEEPRRAERGRLKCCSTETSACVACASCMVRWLETSGGQFRCPRCRGSLSRGALRRLLGPKRAKRILARFPRPAVSCSRFREASHIGVRFCQGCDVAIERTWGCDSMQCSACRYRFCWSCGLSPEACGGNCSPLRTIRVALQISRIVLLLVFAALQLRARASSM